MVAAVDGEQPRMEVQATAMLLTGFYQKPKSFVSCSHINFCLQNISHINLQILYIIQFKTS